MAQVTATTQHVIPIFDGRKIQYNVWCIRARNFLKLKKCWQVVDPTTDVEDEEKNADAFLYICSLVTGIPFTIISNMKGDEEDNARAAWKKIAELYQQKDEKAVATIESRIFRRKWEPDDDVESIMEEFIDKYNELINAGGKTTEETIVQHILQILPIHLKHVATPYEMIAEKKSLHDLLLTLLREEERMKMQGQHIRPRERVARMKDRPPEHQKKKELRRCYFCNKAGHLQKHCRKKIQQHQQQHGRNFTPKQERIFSATAKKSTTTQEPLDGWLLDSGATVHISSDRNDFTDVQDDDTIVEIADGTEVKSLGRGTVKLHTNIGEIMLTDVLLMPKGFKKVMSYSKVIEKGHKILSDHNKEMHIELTTGETLKLLKAGTLYYLMPRTNEIVNAIKSAASTDVLVRELHHLLGHTNEQTIRKNMCEVCMKGKMKKANISKYSGTANSSYLPGEMIVADISGPHPVSLQGAKYALVMKDIASGYVMAGLMGSKQEVAETATTLLINAPRKLNIGNNTCLKTDAEQTFKSQHFYKAMMELKVEVKHSAPYTPQKNGDAERTIQTLTNMSRALLIDARLGEDFWAAAMLHSAYVLNFLGPFQRLFGRNPPLENLQRFGVIAYVKRESTRKWQTRSTQGIYLGFDWRTRAHKIYIPETKRMILTIHARFLSMEESYLQTLTGVTALDLTRSEMPVTKKTPTTRRRTNNRSTKSNMTTTTTELKQPAVAAPTQQTNETTNDDTPTSQDVIHESVANTDTSYTPATATEASIEEMTIEQTISSANKEVEALQPETEAETPTEIQPRRSQRLQNKRETTNTIKTGYEDAVIEELTSLKKHGVFGKEQVHPGKHQQIINTMIIYKQKPDGTKKARLVARGDTVWTDKQDNYNHYSPTASRTTVLALLATSLDSYLTQLDVKTAFLHAQLTMRRYVRVPAEMGGGVYPLRKALYGLRESPRAWYDHIAGVLTTMGWKRAQSDGCLFLKEGCKLLVYVDDMLLITPTKGQAQYIVRQLEKHVQIKEVHNKNFIGMEYEMKEGNMTVKCDAYVNRIASQLHLPPHRCHTPLYSTYKGVGGKEDSDGKEKKKEEEEAEETGNTQQKEEERKLLGILTYLASTCRPDLAYAASILASDNNNNNKEEKMSNLKRALQYAHTQKYSLTTTTKDNMIRAYADASYANDKDRKSRTGYLVTINNMPVSWQSSRQSVTALSSAEAEYIALTEVTKDVLWLRCLMEELDLKQEEATPIYTDSKPAMDIANTTQMNKRTKHIDIRAHFIRDKIRDGIIRTEHLGTKEQPADALTKNMGKTQMRRLLQKFLILDN
eukprot:m.241544 g.241544  ORF g.241544 m.241544 type:complete len:1314 (-) comp17131_c4_seq62:277-4218(-)